MAVTIDELWIPSPNYSYRNTADIRLLVAHCTEGHEDCKDLGYYFQGNVGASSHSGDDNHNTFFGAYVDENDSAWTQCNANGDCISIEQCVPSGASYGWSRQDWLETQDHLLHQTAKWIAHMSAKWNIPIVSLSAAQAQDGHTRGVCDHVDFGQWGCGHGDCGPGYPMDVVIGWAKEYAGGTVPPVQPEPIVKVWEVIDMPVIPAGPNAPALDMSFNGKGEYVAVNLGGDMGTVTPQNATFRVAAHIVGTDDWRVSNVNLTVGNPRQVVEFKGDIDMVSFRWTGGAPVQVVPSFKRPD